MRARAKMLSLVMAAVVTVPMLAVATPLANTAKAAGVFKPEDYGAVANDGKGDTDAINKTIDAAGEAGGGIIEFGPGKYDIDLIDFGGYAVAINVTKPNITFQLTESTVLEVMPTSFPEYIAIHVKGDNFSISGGKLSGNRKGHKGSNGECGHGIGVTDCKNVSISNMTICDSWGDGVYLGSMNLQDNLYGCDGVSIKNCTISNNRRNNIAIVDADNVTIDNCKILKANGVQPACGINIEPNFVNGKIPANEVCKNITIKNTKITTVKKGVSNFYFAFQTIYDPSRLSMVSAKNVKIIGCTFNGDAGNYSGKNVTVKNTKIKGTFYDNKKMKTKIKKSTIKSHYKF